MIDSTKQVLSSMQQEIADLRHEQNHTNYMERMAVQERAKNQPTAA
jgi:L-rhamnose isomerase